MVVKSKIRVQLSAEYTNGLPAGGTSDIYRGQIGIRMCALSGTIYEDGIRLVWIQSHSVLTKPGLKSDQT